MANDTISYRYGFLSQRSEYRQQFLPEIDHKLAVWQAYLNTLNSFQGLESETNAAEGIMQSSSHVSTDRFIYNLAILDGMLEEDKDDQFKREGPKAIVDMVERVDLPEYFRYWARVDSLMRRQGFYTTAKRDMGHL